ncbi:MAG: MarR family winged helix-turn-helix transcriptional regulator [Pseudomonadales bacterium]|nr:MarR family winged helix-turn-helix transcriptional regulator [Pseudomonadales bacterium]
MKSIPKEMSFVVNLWGANSMLSKKIDGSLGAIHGIGFTEYMILFHLSNSHNNIMRRIDLANSVGVTASGVTRIVSPMEKIGLVMKEQNPRDARVSLVKLTPAGEVLFHDATTTIKQSSKRLLDGTSGEGLISALEVFKSICNDRYV